MLFAFAFPAPFRNSTVVVAYLWRLGDTAGPVGFANLSPVTVVLKTRAFSKELQLDINNLYIKAYMKSSLVISSQFSSGVRVRRWC